MALDFPNSPSANQVFTSANGTVWQWDGVKWIAITSTTMASYSGIGRNLIHNPLFNISQRGAGPFNTTGYTLDRWQLSTNLDTTSASQQPMTDAHRAAIGDESAQYFLQIAVTANAGAAAYSEFIHRIENGRRLAGKTVTLSFWANASVPLKLGIGSGTSYGTGGSPSAADVNAMQIVNLVAAWTRYSVTINIPSATGRTFGTNGDSNTYLQFVTSSGTTNFPLVGVQSGIVTLWGVQLEIGNVATPLEKPDPRYDLANCQRFYQLVSINSYVNNQIATGEATASSAFATTMRTSPTVAVQSNTSINLTTTTVGGDTRGAFLSGTTTANGTTKFIATLTATADL